MHSKVITREEWRGLWRWARSVQTGVSLSTPLPQRIALWLLWSRNDPCQLGILASSRREIPRGTEMHMSLVIAHRRYCREVLDR